MPPRRARGRHRRPRATGGPAYLSAVALVALAILGLNAPGTSDARQVSATAAGALAVGGPVAVPPLRRALTAQQRDRDDRLRAARKAMVQAAQGAAQRARRLRERASRSRVRELPGLSGLAAGTTGEQGLLWPLQGRITSYAGRRTNPVSGRPSCHAGVDIAAPSGTPIRAMADGVVRATKVSAWDGLTTVVAHEGGLTTWYTHQSRFGVRPGQRVEAGQVIGYVGSSGNSTGPHLQLNVAVNDVPYDPLGWFGGPRRTVASLCEGGPAPVL